jgi:hypothetical protein
MIESTSSLQLVSSFGVGKTNCWFVFDWLMSCLNCNLVLNCAGSPRCFSSWDCKMESAISYQNWLENPIMILFPTCGILLEVCNRNERCPAWSPVAMTSHVRTLSVLLFQASTSMSSALFIPSSGYTTWLCLCVSNIGWIHSLLLVIVKLYP